MTKLIYILVAIFAAMHSAGENPASENCYHRWFEQNIDKISLFQHTTLYASTVKITSVLWYGYMNLFVPWRYIQLIQLTILLINCVIFLSAPPNSTSINTEKHHLGLMTFLNLCMFVIAMKLYYCKSFIQCFVAIFATLCLFMIFVKANEKLLAKFYSPTLLNNIEYFYILTIVCLFFRIAYLQYMGYCIWIVYCYLTPLIIYGLIVHEILLKKRIDEKNDSPVPSLEELRQTIDRALEAGRNRRDA